ncbi:MAG TPA: hypothetical protein VHP33_11725 [Polyangiaceae bacterium]|nr:hypothetical protein [Polyangiaceae bacterium]
MRLRRLVVLALAALAVPAACGTERAPYLVDPGHLDSGSAGEDGGLMLGDAPEVPTGPCGSQSLPVVENPPNLSFIIDHSASMGDELAGSGLSKYENARIALSHVLAAIGHRVNYGATIFPGLAGVTGCEAGDQLMPVSPGDPPSYARDGQTGPRLKDLLGRLSIADVDGGTPAAATLLKSLDTLTELSGPTYVILVTDGAPNCNEALSCKAAQCIPNIEGLTAGGLDCSTGVNCCMPSKQNPNANLSCVDQDASLQAVQALTDAGISTFVVGMPGSEPYDELLNAMAEVGGTARAGDVGYYSVADTDALEQALKAIAASVAISCEIPLDYEPPDPDFVNVYFDGKVVEYDPEAGWEWTEDGHVAIRGTACERLSKGDVLEVQILAGCKTVVK